MAEIQEGIAFRIHHRRRRVDTDGAIDRRGLSRDVRGGQHVHVRAVIAVRPTVSMEPTPSGSEAEA